MLSRPWRSALAFSCIELLAVVPSARGMTAEQILSLEQELVLANDPGLYLVIDRVDAKLTIKARGLELDSIPIVDFALVRTTAARTASAAFEPPPIWTVLRTRRSGYRRIVAPPPDSLATEQAESDEAAPTQVQPQTVAAIELPSAYVIELADGWTLRVSDERSRPGLIEQLRLGWGAALQATSDESSTRHELRLRLAPADAQRLFHILRPGQRILLSPTLTPPT